MTVVNEAERLWATVAALLAEQLSDAVWMSTFQGIRGKYLDSNSLTLTVPSILAKERIESRYGELLDSVLRDAGHDGLVIELRVETKPAETEASPAPEHGSDTEIAAVHPAPTSATVSTQPTVDTTPTRATAGETPVQQRYSFDTFVTGPSNRFAQAAALSVAETPARSYNPLFMYGGAGLGKTHLLRAIGNYLGQNYPHYRVRYISTETLFNEFIDAIRYKDQNEFKRRYREDLDVLLVDDVQFMEGKEQIQEEFFHTFNALYEANRQIVLSSDRPPDAIATLEDRLRSRFKMGLITDIQPPDFETRFAIVKRKAEQQHMGIPSSVIEFIVTHITNNIRELEGALNRVTAYASLNRTEPTVEQAKEVLADIIGDGANTVVTPDRILDTTAAYFSFTVDDLKAKNRQRPLVHARQIAMYLFRELTEMSYPQIAQCFGGRDHTTVMHACEKIKSQMTEREQTFTDVQALIQQLKTPARREQ